MAAPLLLEMSITREDFLRLLPGAVGLATIEEAGGVFTHAEGPRRWTIHLVPMADWCAGSVVLVRHRVELRFEGYSEEAVAAFLARFHRGFQRGGG